MFNLITIQDMVKTVLTTHVATRDDDMKGKDWSYGYQCYNQLNNGSAKKRREAGLEDDGYCDVSMIADWKLEVMSKALMERLWGDRKESVQLACKMIKEYYQSETPRQRNNAAIIKSKIAQIKTRLNSLIDMRTDGEISKEQFAERRDKLEADLKATETELAESGKSADIPKETGLRWNAIMETLNQVVDLSAPVLNREIIEKFVIRVIPQDKRKYVWKINLDKSSTEDYDVVVEGRKSHYTVILPGDSPDGDDPSPLHTNIIYFADFAAFMQGKKYSPRPTHHRRRSKVWMQKNKLPKKLDFMRFFEEGILGDCISCSNLWLKK